MIKLTVPFLALTALLLTTPLAAADAAESQTLQGEFVWERQDGTVAGPLTAVFEPTAKGAWDVSFHFTFEDKDYVYTGTAEGSLSEGELKGNVMSDGDEPQPYTFSGTFAKDGSFAGVHHYLGDEEARKTGSMTLAR